MDNIDFEEYEQMIDDCENRDHRLNEWSRGFLASLRERCGELRPLTDNQVEKLNEVWEHATLKG